MHAHSAKSTVAVFNVLASETWIDIAHTGKGGVETHWISESGILDLFLLPGPTPTDVFAQYARLTGTAPLPAHWSLGYHQCRWNYVSSDDVRGVQNRFDEEDIPVDVFWLDIEYAEDHKYFVWNKKTFPDPVDMTKDVEAVERKVCFVSLFFWCESCAHACMCTPDGNYHRPSLKAFKRLPSVQTRIRTRRPR
jgi:alpha 1,3-glucosidase